MRIPLRCLLINDKRKEVPPVPLSTTGTSLVCFRYISL